MEVMCLLNNVSFGFHISGVCSDVCSFNIISVLNLNASTTLLLTSISLCLTAAAAHASSNVQEYLDHGQSEGGVRPSLSLIGLDHDMSLTCLFLNSRETF